MSLNERKRSTIQAAIPAGESVSPYATVCGFVACICEYATSSVRPVAAHSLNRRTGSGHGFGGG